MNKVFIIIILIAEINYLYSTPAHSFSKKNLKNERKLENLSDDIVIIHLNDVHCGVNDAIGYDGFVLYRKELKKKYKYVLAVDVGDHIQGGTLGAISQGSAIKEIMNKINFNVTTLGNHEFDYVIKNLFNLNNNMTSQYICANLYYRRNMTRIFPPSKVIEVSDKKIGFIGVVTPLTFSKTYMSTVRDSDGNLVYNFLSNTSQLYSTIQEEINKLRNEEKVDYVILLAHIGMDVEDYTSNDLVSKLNGVDAVLDGHTHKVYNTTSKDMNNKDVYFTQTGTKLANIGKLIIKTDGTIHTENIAEVPEPEDIDGAVKVTRSKAERWVDTEMKEFIESTFNDYADELEIPIGYSDYDFIIRPEGSSDSHTIYCRYQECTLGNLIADAFKNVVNADASFVNGGAIRTNLLKGNITRNNILDILPFFNNLYVKEVTGQAILDALELGVSKTPNAFGGFPQVGGCTFDIDTSINSSVVTDPDGMFINITGPRRISNAKINGKPIDAKKYYNLSASDYILNGGDGFTMFKEFKTVNESVFADNDALGYYISIDLDGRIPSQYKNLQGRIKIDADDEDTDESGINTWIFPIISMVLLLSLSFLLYFIIKK